MSFKVTPGLLTTRGHFFKGLQNCIEIKNEGNENKIILRNLIALWIKWTGMVEIKHKDFIDAE